MGSTPEQVTNARDTLVRDTLGQASLGLGALLAFFAVADPWIYPSWAVPTIVLFDAVAALLFLVVHLAHRRGELPVALAHPVGAGLALFVTLNILHDTWLVLEPEQTIYLMLVVIGCGSIFLNRRWLYGMMTIAFGSWLFVATRHPHLEWTIFGLGLFAASVLAGIVHELRLTTHNRLEEREAALHETFHALTNSEERFRRLVEDAPDAFLVHVDRRIVYANPAAARLFGATQASDLIGRDSTSFVDAADLQRLTAAALKSDEEGRPTDPTEIRLRRFDGTEVHVEVVRQAIDYGGVRADQTIVHDITDRKRIEQERTLAAQRLREIDRLHEMNHMRTEFINAVSHELRTPLTPIKVQLHLLKMANSTPEQRARTVAVLDRNVQRLGALLDELLEVARIQAGRLTIERKPLDMRETLAQAVEAYIDVGKAAGVTVTLDAEPGLRIAGDAKRLAQVIDNLLGNALKFTPSGGRIHVEARNIARSVVVLVQDTGSGMTREAIAQLFHPFSQVHDTSQTTARGTGLGLYLAKGLIEGHGGRIWAESEGPGRGSLFAFQLPLLTEVDIATAPDAIADDAEARAQAGE